MGARPTPDSETMRYVFDRLPDLVLILDPTATEILDVNEDGARALGWSQDEMIGEKLHRFCMPNDLAPSALQEPPSKEDVVSFERLTLRGDGTFESYNFVGTHLGEVDNSTILVGRPMDRLLSSDSQLYELLKLADLASDGFVVSDAEGRVRYANRATSDLSGVAKPLGRSVKDFLRVDERYRSQLNDVLLTGTGEVRATIRKVDGTIFPVASRAAYDEEHDRWYSVVRDISEMVATEKELSALNEALRAQASTDWLTQLANRSSLEEQLERVTIINKPFTLLMLDVDDFKSVNDTLGHTAGDELLQAIASRLRAAVSGDDFIARLGGDEFVVLLEDTTSDQASVVAERIIALLREPYDVANGKLSRSCSVGLATFDPTLESTAILRQVDRALYRAKALGRNQYVVYDDDVMSDVFDPNAESRSSSNDKVSRRRNRK